MIFHVLTLFPNMIRDGLHTSIMGRAQEKHLIEILATDIRDYTTQRHGKVDDYTYGGGAGMLMQAQPVYDAWKAVSKEKKIRTIYVTPQGTPFHQCLARELAREDELIFVCGHYEGIDERVLEEMNAEYISIGDYVLTGGELPAMVMIDAIARLVPGVLNNDGSAETESFHNDLLEYPQYSRPEIWHEKRVPEVLLSGNHKKIEEWRLAASEEKTKKIRPDLYEKYQEKQRVIRNLRKHKKENVYLIDALTRGMAEVIFSNAKGALGYQRENDIWMLCADDLETGKEMLSRISGAGKLLVHNCRELNDLLCEQYQFELYEECTQAVYTPKEVLTVEHKDIRLLTMESLPYLAEHYGDEDHSDYLADRIRNKAMFGAFVENNLVAFAGLHREGSMGILFVDPAYRRMHLGTSLVAFLVNRVLEKGGIPYAHTILGNESSYQMQERMGLYTAGRNIFWLGKS